MHTSWQLLQHMHAASLHDRRDSADSAAISDYM